MFATARQLRAFTAVAREGGFAKAAARLGVTQPAVTLQVRALEEAYGVVLFERRGGTATLNELGHELYALTRQIEGLEAEVDDLLNAQYDLATGSLTVATGSPRTAMNLIGRFRERYPHCRVNVSIGNHKFVWDEIVERRADVAVDTNIPNDKRIYDLPYHPNAIVLLAPRGHPISRQKSVNLATLENEKLVMRSDRSKTQLLVEQMMREAGAELVPDLMVSGREAVQEAVAAGLGLGFMFEREVGDDPRIRVVRIDQPSASTVESVFCLKAQARRRLVMAFLDVAREFRDDSYR